MENRFLLRVMHIRQLYEKQIEECSNEIGLTTLEINIVLFLVNHPNYNTARDICNLRMIPKSNASNGIRLLERKDLLRIEQDGENIKLHRLFLTEKGQRYVEYLRGKQQEFLNHLSEALTMEEWAHFLEMLDKIDNQAKKEMGMKKE